MINQFYYRHNTPALDVPMSVEYALTGNKPEMTI